MILDARKNPNLRGVLVDAATNQPIRWARWANLATGEFEAFKFDPKRIKDLGGCPTDFLYRGRTALKFVEDRTVPIRTPGNLDGKAVKQQMEEIRRTTTPKLLIPGDYCEVRGCHRLSAWSVADERILEPLPGPDGRLQERGIIVDVHAYCDRHFRLPVSTSLRGVESEVEVKIARPQW